MAKDRKEGQGGKAAGNSSRKPTLAQALKVTATLAALGASLGVNVETLFAAGAADVKGPAGLESVEIRNNKAGPAGGRQMKVAPAVPDSNYGKQPVAPGAAQGKIESPAAEGMKHQSSTAIRNKAKAPAAIQNKAKAPGAVQHKTQSPGATQIKIDGRAPGATQIKGESQQGKIGGAVEAVQKKHGPGGATPGGAGPGAVK